MVREILELKTDNGLGANNPSFKGITITEYSFKSPRMGMPSLTATLMWPTCLDDEWTGKEYVKLRGEKYYIRQTQSSEISNNNIVKYKHSLDFKSEREQLLHVYFYDVVPSDISSSNSAGHDKPNTNSTTFKIFCTPREFCDRLNCAFRYAGIGDSILNTKTTLTDSDTPTGDGYCVVLSSHGDGDLEQSQNIEWEDKWLFDALLDGFNKFKIPFCFHGKKIVFNEYVEPIGHIFKYGFGNTLLSVNKNNANARIINRITFKGSSENIPYFYPNETEYGHINLGALDTNKLLTASDFAIVNPRILVSKTSAQHPITLQVDASAEASLNDISYRKGNDEYSKLIAEKWYRANDNVGPNEPYFYSFDYRINFSVEYGGDVVISNIAGKCWTTNSSIPDSERAQGDNLIGQRKLRILRLNKGLLDFSGRVEIVDSKIIMHDLSNGEYDLDVNIEWSYSDTVYWWRIDKVQFLNENRRDFYWQCNDDTTTDLEKWGVKFVKTQGSISLNSVGDGFKWDSSPRAPFQKDLMPPKYRATLGKERFYNALNSTYLKKDGQTYYTFKNPYVEGNPSEYIYIDETIKPTIEGVKNSNNELFGVISAVAFDIDDNDSLKTDAGDGDKDKNDSANYVHSFFYIRLNKFDGSYGFDLFNSASQTDPMTIQMTSGKCNGCKFKIQVIEEEHLNDKLWRNPVQTYGVNGNIVSGTQSQIIDKDNPQEWQQDTSKNYIWIAVQKDAETFGVIMPNRSHNYLPEAGDTFNIINIDLPQGYITAAEERGMYAMLDFMENNNEEKFNFDITASRIFFAKNPDILAALNENSRIKIQYDGKLYEQYVSEFAIDCKDSETLPDVKLTLANTLEPIGSFVDEVVAQVADISKTSVQGGSNRQNALTLGITDERYMRKDKDEHTEHRISSDTAFEVGNFVSGSQGGILLVDPETGKSTLEVDYFKARLKAVFETLEIAHVRSIGGKLTITPGSSINITFVEELDGAYRCYFKQQEESEGADCRFIVGDDVICQSFNISNGLSQNASNKRYWRKVTAVSNSGSYIELSKTVCEPGSAVPEIGDTICQLGSNDVSRQSAIILSTVDTFSPNITLYDGITGFTLSGKEVVDMGVDKTTHKAYFHVYGNAYIGDKEGRSYLKYDNLLKELEIKAKLSVDSVIENEKLGDYISSFKTTSEGLLSQVGKISRNLAQFNSGAWSAVPNIWSMNGVPQGGAVYIEQFDTWPSDVDTTQFRCLIDATKLKPDTDYTLTFYATCWGGAGYDDEDMQETLDVSATICSLTTNSVISPRKSMQSLPHVWGVRTKHNAVLHTNQSWSNIDQALIISFYTEYGADDWPGGTDIRFDIEEIKLEEGSFATPFVEPQKDIESVISQQADQIAMAVKVDGEERAGLTLDADDGITLQADKVTIKNGDELAALFTNGTLNANLISVGKLMTLVNGARSITISEFNDGFIRFYQSDGVRLACKIGLELVAIEDNITIEPLSDNAKDSSSVAIKADSVLNPDKNGKLAIIQVFNASGELKWVLFLDGPKSPDAQTYRWNSLSLAGPYTSITNNDVTSTKKLQATQLWQFHSTSNGVEPYKSQNDKVFRYRINDSQFASASSYYALNGYWFSPTAEVKPSSVGDSTTTQWRRRYYVIQDGVMSAAHFVDVTE